MTSISLPFPLSVNNLFLNVKGRGRVPTKAYQAWKAAAWAEIAQQRPEKIAGPVSVVLSLKAPDRRRRDADNLFKSPLDALVRHGIIEADDNRIVRSVSANWVNEGPACLVTIQPVQEA